VPAQLAFVTPPQTLTARACSTVLRAQLQGACGAPVASDGGTVVSLGSTSGSLGFFGDGSCIGSPSQWVIPNGAATLDVFFKDPAMGTPTLRVSAPGLDAGTQVATINCAAGEKPCGATCIPTANCCADGDCNDGGVAYVCRTGACVPPACSGFPSNCTTYEDHTASNDPRIITFDSSGYSPRCMRISSGQTVTFQGTFFLHPLQQTCGDDEAMTTTSGSSRSFQLFGIDTWGFRCASHPAFESGAIRTY
jgi:hypothetical protein